MIRLLAFVALLFVLALGFSILADTPGHVLVQVGETEYRVSLITATGALFVLVVALMTAWSILRLALRLPSLIGLANRMRRQARGQQAVARGLVAIGTGDQRLARRYADESRRLLGTEPLALLLDAQAAQLAGNTRSAADAFHAMLARPDTTALGLRGLHVEAMRQGDTAAARRHAEEALRQAPASAWAGEAMLGYLAAERDWRGAIAIIDQSVSRRVLDRAEGRRRRAVLLAAAARDALDGNPDEALTLALDALRIEPGLVVAATIAARRYSALGNYARATKLLEAAWKAGPHPDIAEAYLSVRPGDSALDRLRRARSLAKLMPNDRESRFAVARAGIDAREFPVAREALETLVLEKLTVRACLLMAELEQIESSNDGLVRAWLARASLAPRDPAWIADGFVADEWAPVSPISGRIGAFEWREPPQTRDAHLRLRLGSDPFAPPPLAALETEAATPDRPAPPEAATIEARPFQPIIPDDPGPEPDEQNGEDIQAGRR